MFRHAEACLHITGYLPSFPAAEAPLMLESFATTSAVPAASGAHYRPAPEGAALQRGT